MESLPNCGTSSFAQANQSLFFDVVVYRRPIDVVSVGEVASRDVALKRFKPTCIAQRHLFERTFEEVVDQLAASPRMDVELDGYFVQTGGDGDVAWQVDGHLYELDGRLWRMELRGRCPGEALDAILKCVGWPAIPLVFELVREGVIISELDFRQWTAVGPSSREGPGS